MDESRKSLPPPTLSKLIPPSADHHYFEGYLQHPFRPSDDSYSLANAWWLAEASLLVYGDETFVREQLRRSGLDGALGMRPRFFVGAARGTQCLVLEAERFVIVAFRGTRIESFPDPILNLKMRLINGVDLATDVDFRLDPTARVHSGFNRALDEIWGELRGDLEGLARQDEGKTFWFTGHSLGAALATLAAGRAGNDLAAALYTFGSPRVGDEVFRERFSVPCFRFVNNNDVVPHLPPRGWLADYAHVGSLKFIDSSGRIMSDPDQFDMIESYVRGHILALKTGFETFNPASLKEAGRAILDAANRRDPSGLSDRLESLNLDFIPFAALSDHMPCTYAIKVWNALIAARSSDG